MSDLSALEELMIQAREARGTAYAPYSGFNVGAALLLEDGTVVTGANVENASYGLSICAERAAVFAAARLRETPGKRPVAMAIAANAGEAAFPCGACRQVLSEFADELEIAVEAAPETGAPHDGSAAEERTPSIKRLLLSELLPSPFKKD